jgi:hypothetical protein
MASMANRKSEWICRKCGAGVTLFIKPSEPPTHECKKQRNQITQLVKKD